MRKTSEILTEARAIIADPAQWTQEALARDKDGNMVAFSDPAAVCFCAAGAIGKASGAVIDDRGDWDSSDYTTASLYLAKAAFRLADTSAYTGINDGTIKLTDHRDLSAHESILLVLDNAIGLAKFMEGDPCSAS
ncbi:hypothetical protein [Bradyrhizobium sp. SZCCHNR3118]|uniref:DUF6197 family protein n=1 Tax=Bradyrhizobium sp. SZCCHNR3118 TaxID=3057468 RepID=UPI002916B22A|nr:hypothetical protein [Bradyrhizobium sp. SZCCHNR3118]